MNLLAMSFEGELAPSFDLRCLRGERLPDGWGLGYYPGGDPAATVLKEPNPAEGSIRGDLVKAWEHLESSLFMVHIRTATWGAASDANTQPFVRSYARRDWMFGHSGSLRHGIESRPKARFEPVGGTDTEQVFCDLLDRIAEKGWRSLAEADPMLLRGWLDAFNEHGTLSAALTDGRDLYIYADRDGDPIHVGQLRPPYERLALGDTELSVDLTRRGTKPRKGVVASTGRLDVDTDGACVWRILPPGHLLVLRQGAVMTEVGPSRAGPGVAPVARHGRDVTRLDRTEPRRFHVVHRTTYTYERPVERSQHIFRLEPLVDRLQTVSSSEVHCSVDGKVRIYDDVFGNRIRRLHLDRPYQELLIEARSTVDVLDVDPLDYRPLQARTLIPLVWMPWQRHMLQPFLLPPELPASELDELLDYAMSFVRRNDYDLLSTLCDMTQTIFREYAYRPGVTTLSTTAYEVYVTRQGVCQDFTNLFICLARLLSVPARYVCGYVYTGEKSANHAMSEASHAWAQVYLPEAGWKGFDPTNGIITQTDHVRVAVGRNYRDTTPTSGTIYVGGGGETLAAEVRIERE